MMFLRSMHAVATYEQGESSTHVRFLSSNKAPWQALQICHPSQPGHRQLPAILAIAGVGSHLGCGPMQGMRALSMKLIG
jgi:hypothetical protein